MINIFIDKKREDYDHREIAKWMDEHAVDYHNNRHHWYTRFTDNECVIITFGESDSATAVAFKLKFGL